MRKAFSVLLLSMLAPLLFAVSIDMHIGVISGIGASWDTGEWILGADLESSFPSYAIGCGISYEDLGDGTYEEGFRLGTLYFLGADLSAYRTVLDTKHFKASVGLDVLTGVEIPIRNIELVIKPGIRLDVLFGKHSDLFIVGNLPVLDCTYAPGFKYPYTRFPVYNWASLLTGCRLGYSYSI